jgi:uncharacterized iron-regulated membrane protein
MTIGRAILTTLVGLMIAAGCLMPFYFIGHRDPINDSVDMGIVLLGICGMFGVIIVAVGLIMVAIRLWHGKGRILP